MGSLRGKQARTNLATAGHNDAGMQGSRGTSTTGFSGGANVQEFQTFYQENLGLIYRFVYSKVGNREEAEDLTSQIFMKAVRGVDTERGALSMQKWLFQVARTTIADHWRAHYRISTSSLDQLLEIGWEGPADEEPAAGSSTPTDRVHRILQALPEHYREVLTCRFLLNLSIRDTANRLCLTEANVKVLQFRALKRAADLERVVNGIS
ncbi:MAG TPA: sigma-70 family RNA polymerase sigma factor [Ktedonobacteraceae bacterium]|nr:sigma-70 family RNA polymerase sigma factor [Ktedonobacteraceae bacterium]